MQFAGSLDKPEEWDLGLEFTFSSVEVGNIYSPRSDFVACPPGNIDNIYILEE
jgi:hypothetical protein